MSANLSKTQIDRLGNRLKKDTYAESDLDMLDEFRRSFGEAYEEVVRTVFTQIQVFPTGRPDKTTGSIVAKLRRESIRLSQMQDIVGCRVIVENIVAQERTVASLIVAFPTSSVVDRRYDPSHGYRAVHLIPKIDGKPVEIQIRTELQHLWAEYSEKTSDRVGSVIKYGGGREEFRSFLANSADLIAAYEANEMRVLLEASGSESFKQDERDMLVKVKTGIADLLKGMISEYDDLGTREP